MKIIRQFSPEGRSVYAALQADGSCLEIEGDLFTGCRVTDRAMVPGERLAPIAPTNIIGIGLNYRRHAEEGGKPLPVHPLWFMKTTGAVQHPGAPIVLPRTAPSEQVDYEGELAVVIGRACRDVKPGDALGHVLGYTVANDVSARDWQFRLGSGQFCHGKSFDTFCPLGPVLATADEIPDPQRLRLVTRLNGRTMQDGSTADMIHPVAELIAFLSRSRTLPAGTVILTGSPHGVGYTRQPPVWLRPGDTVSVEIEGIGTLENPVTEA